MPTPLTSRGLCATETNRQLTPDEVLAERIESHRQLNRYLDEAVQNLSRAWEIAVHIDQRATVERAIEATHEARQVAGRLLVVEHRHALIGLPSPQINKEDQEKVQGITAPTGQKFGGSGY